MLAVGELRRLIVVVNFVEPGRNLRDSVVKCQYGGHTRSASHSFPLATTPLLAQHSFTLQQWLRSFARPGAWLCGEGMENLQACFSSAAQM
jgi:hypothetical protein